MMSLSLPTLRGKNAPRTIYTATHEHHDHDEDDDQEVEARCSNNITYCFLRTVPQDLGPAEFVVLFGMGGGTREEAWMLTGFEGDYKAMDGIASPSHLGRLGSDMYLSFLLPALWIARAVLLGHL
jgi:hypothetical protein